MIHPTAQSLAGQRLGRYVLHRLLAQGGMGAVYLAQLEGTQGFEKWVALKLVLPDDGDRRTEMFLDEAKVAARIHHPHVCAVTDFGEHQGVPFLAMEYLHGESLSDISREARAHGGLPRWFVARVVADAARGLHAAHELVGDDGEPLSIVHRDVSPHNIQVLYDGAAKIMDFGVARARGQASRTRTGEMKGKLSFMAPEQVDRGPIDRRTDVWGLGVVLWETTLGQRLFLDESEGRTLRNVLKKPIPRPTEVDPDYPADLEAIVLAALARDLDERTGSAGEVADQLERYLHGLAHPTGPAQVARYMNEHFPERKVRRQRWLRAGPEATRRSDQAAGGAGDAASSSRGSRSAPSDDHESDAPSVWGTGPLHGSESAVASSPGSSQDAVLTRDDRGSRPSGFTPDSASASVPRTPAEAAPQSDASDTSAAPQSDASDTSAAPQSDASDTSAAPQSDASDTSTAPQSDASDTSAAGSLAAGAGWPEPTTPARRKRWVVPAVALLSFAGVMALAMQLRPEPPNGTSPAAGAASAPLEDSRDPGPVQAETSVTAPTPASDRVDGSATARGPNAPARARAASEPSARSASEPSARSASEPSARSASEPSARSASERDKGTAAPAPRPRARARERGEASTGRRMPSHRDRGHRDGSSRRSRSSSRAIPRPSRRASSRPETKLARARAEPSSPAGGSKPRGSKPTGTLNLLTIPPARVRVGDRELGTTPLANVRMPAGRHELTLVPLEGGPPKRATIMIAAGERTRASLTLATLP